MDNLQDKLPPSKPINRQAVYSKASSYALEAIDVIVDIMRTSKNDNARLGAANKIVDKILPDLKAQEFTDEGGKSLIEKIIIVKASDEDKAVQVAG